MNKKPLSDKNKRRGSERNRASKWLLVATLAVAVFLIVLLTSAPRNSPEQVVLPTENLLSERAPEAKPKSVQAASALEDQPIPASDVLTPTPVEFKKKVLVDKQWNSEPDALGRFDPEEGAVLGPTAVAYLNNAIYVFDNNDLGEGKLLVYDADGKLTASVPLEDGLTWADLVVDSSDSSLYVIDHPNGKIYKIEGSEIREVQEVSLRDFALGERFGYDRASGTLYVHDHELGGDVPILVNGHPVDPGDRIVQTLSPVWGVSDPENNRNLILNFNDGKDLTVAFNRPIESLDEMTIDNQGRVWVIFTFEGDYRERRVARIDPARNTAEFELLDIQFSYETVRRMTPSGNGIVIVAGDDDNGRLLALQ